MSEIQDPDPKWFNPETGEWDMEQPITPYAGTSGWSGSAASEERAKTEDADGTTSERQRRVLSMVKSWGHNGVTVKEVRETLNLHHGQASSALSVLHKVGLLARLSDKRDRCHVYVLPDNVDGRKTDAHGRKRTPEYEVFKAGYEIASPMKEVPDWETQIAYDLWKKERNDG